MRQPHRRLAKTFHSVTIRSDTLRSMDPQTPDLKRAGVKWSDREWADLMGRQLKSLCEVAEQLTYRVLELEERLAQQEHELGAHSARRSRHHFDHALEQRLR